MLYFLYFGYYVLKLSLYQMAVLAFNIINFFARNLKFPLKNHQKSGFSKSFSSITHFPLNNLWSWSIGRMCVLMRPIDWRTTWVEGVGGKENFYIKTSIFSSSQRIISSREQVDERNMMQSCCCDLGCMCVCVCDGILR